MVELPVDGALVVLVELGRELTVGKMDLFSLFSLLPPLKSGLTAAPKALPSATAMIDGTLATGFVVDGPTEVVGWTVIVEELIAVVVSDSDEGSLFLGASLLTCISESIFSGTAAFVVVVVVVVVEVVVGVDEGANELDVVVVVLSADSTFTTGLSIFPSISGTFSGCDSDLGLSIFVGSSVVSFVAPSTLSSLVASVVVAE